MRRPPPRSLVSSLRLCTFSGAKSDAVCRGIRFFAAVWLAGLTADLAARDWQSLLADSPFGHAAVASPLGKAGDLEFRGVVQEGEACYVNFFNLATRVSLWMPVRSRSGELAVADYDAVAQQVQVTQGGQSLTLPLKQARVELARMEAVAPSPPVDEEKAEKAYLDERLAEMRTMNRGALPGDGDPAALMRNLPPDVQAMLEQFRRRRAERAGAKNGGEAVRRNATVENN